MTFLLLKMHYKYWRWHSGFLCQAWI